MRRPCPGVPHVEGTSAVEVHGLRVDRNGQPALEGVSFTLQAGRLLGVVGPNGAGKTTLLRVVAGDLSPTSGEVRVFGQRPSLHLCIGYLPQRAEVDFRFPLTVADVVAMGRYGRLGVLGRWGGEDGRKVQEALHKVGLERLARRSIAQLSGGERQRMFIARALAQEAHLLLLDEPLAGLDAPAQVALLGLVHELCEGGISVVLALHEIGLAEAHFPSVLLLNRRMIGFGSPAEVFTTEGLQQAYGKGFRILEGWATLGESCCGKGHNHG